MHLAANQPRLEILKAVLEKLQRKNFVKQDHHSVFIVNKFAAISSDELFVILTVLHSAK